MHTIKLFGCAILGFLLGVVLPIASAADVDTRAQTFRRVAESSVIVFAGSDASGSGTVVFTIPRGAYVLSCAHVLAPEATGPEAKIRVGTEVPENGARAVFEAEVVGIDRGKDLLLVFVPTLRARALPIATTIPPMFTKLVMVGAPLTIPNTASEPMLTSRTRGRPDANRGVTWQLTGGFFYSGLSGGTVANDRGELVCVPQAMHGVRLAGLIDMPLPQVGYCIPYNTVRAFLSAHLEGLL